MKPQTNPQEIVMNLIQERMSIEARARTLEELYQKIQKLKDPEHKSSAEHYYKFEMNLLVKRTIALLKGHEKELNTKKYFWQIWK